MDSFLPEGRCTLLYPADIGLPPSNELTSPLAVGSCVEPLPESSKERVLSSLGSCTSDLMPLILLLLLPEPDDEEEEELEENEDDVLDLCAVLWLLLPTLDGGLDSFGDILQVWGVKE